jgi:hypothetical protein
MLLEIGHASITDLEFLVLPQNLERVGAQCNNLGLRTEDIGYTNNRPTSSGKYLLRQGYY